MLSRMLEIFCSNFHNEGVLAVCIRTWWTQDPRLS